jgi:(R)-benzylsuccinyl-CoA dehydrogenase
MMNFEISEEYNILKGMAQKFREKELDPLESSLLEREMRMWTDQLSLLDQADHDRLMSISRDMGFWGIDVDEKLGGQGLGMFAKTLVVEELSKSLVGFSHHGFTLPPDTPNLYYLNEFCTEAQKEKYLRPYCEGRLESAMAVTEPAAGSDIGGLKLKAEKKGDVWLLNGTKTFISKCDHDNLFFILIAVTNIQAGKKDRFTAFLVDKNTPGLTVGSVIPVIGAMPTWEVFLSDVELSSDQVLGPVGGAFIPLQNRFGVRRIELAAKCIGMAERLIQMMINQANMRSTFGEKLANRQTVQNWIADATIELASVRLMLYFAAWKADQGAKDLRQEGSILKVKATEMLTEITDKAIQLYGGMGLSKELGIEYVARMVRIWRILEGPSEIHRMSIARLQLKKGHPYNPVESLS